MLIPSIDLMGGKVVQLVQGTRKALESSDLDRWIARFRAFPLVQLIDLDAAMQQGSNLELVRRVTRALPCQVGGGIRSAEAALDLLQAGARRVIIGSALVRDGELDLAFAAALARQAGREHLTFALDSRRGRLAIHGWRTMTAISALHAVRRLEPYCSAFLYTNIQTEGLMAGLPLSTVRALRRATSNQLIAAGGITTWEEIDRLDALRIDAVVGMALYTGRLAARPTVAPRSSQKPPDRSRRS